MRKAARLSATFQSLAPAEQPMDGNGLPSQELEPTYELFTPQAASGAVLLGNHVGGGPGRLSEGRQLVGCHPMGHGHVLWGVHVGAPFGGNRRCARVGARLGSHLLVLLQEGRVLRMLQCPCCRLPRLQLALHNQQPCGHQSGAKLNPRAL